MSTTHASETTLKRLVDEREGIHRKHENKLAEINTREDPMPTSDERDLLKRYRDELETYDEQIGTLSRAVLADQEAEEESRKMRRLLADGANGIDVDDNGNVAYRTMAEYARDYIITRNFQTAGMIAAQVPKEEVQRAAERIDMVMRAPTNTTSSTVAGLIPPQHISQIFQYINTKRDMVDTAMRTDLVRGTITYPSLDTKPVVAVQGSEKTEGGTTGLALSMVTATASTYIGGGDLSWQAINWSTPNALDLWFRVIAADYALKTETDAATVVSASAFLHKISSTISSTPTFAEFMTAVGAGAAKVYADSGRTANTVYMAPDRYWYIFGTTSSAFAQFATVSTNGIGGVTPALSFVQSRGLNSGEIIVGDREGLLVAETAGAPVELRVVEPSIGGVEVGLIGAFEAVVVDAGAFSEITTAS